MASAFNKTQHIHNNDQQKPKHKTARFKCGIKVANVLTHQSATLRQFSIDCKTSFPNNIAMLKSYTIEGFMAVFKKAFPQ